MGQRLHVEPKPEPQRRSGAAAAYLRGGECHLSEQSKMAPRRVN